MWTLAAQSPQEEHLIGYVNVYQLLHEQHSSLQSNCRMEEATVSDSPTQGGGSDRVSWSVGQPAARRVGGGSIQSPHP